jgi:Fe-S oxidoreductase
MVATSIAIQSVVREPKEPNMLVKTPYREAVGLLVDEGGETLQLCYQCASCTGSCPWGLVRDFGIHKIMHEAQLGVVDFEDEDIWLCVACGACVNQCPRGVQLIDVVKAIRRTVMELGAGKSPGSLQMALTGIAGVGNPMGQAEEKRADWAEDTDVKTFTQGTDLLYFPCCLPCYDPLMKGIATATASILNKAGVDFGILGTNESCCGEAVRRAGNENLFQSLAKRNIATFGEYEVKQILVSSPHCYHTFKNEYPDIGSNFEVIHSAQYLLQLIKDHKLEFTRELNTKAVYHDSCYLGRHNGIYEEPREVLRSIPGLELIEFPDCREDSICCGGGAGRLWMDTEKGQRFSDIKLRQAIDLGVEVLAVACPYCMSMFKDSQLTVDKGETVAVKDIAELVKEAI